MCGIVGALSGQDVAPLMLDGLRRLEYRGYDSAGLATLTEDGIDQRKAAGKLLALDQLLQQSPLKGHAGIGHTRWATHGPPTVENAHPHRAGRVAIVHNGIIENHDTLKADLMAKGVDFQSDTDTEVVAHLLDRELQSGKTAREAMAKIVPQLKGAYAFVVLVEGEEDLLLAARRASPLAIGIGNDEAFVGSDAMALAPLTNRVIYLEDGDWAAISRSKVELFDEEGQRVERKIHVSSLSGAMIGKGNFRHFMEKEIHDQPEAIAHTMHAVLDPGTGTALLPHPLDDPKSIQKITILAAGTSSYAGLTARYWLESLAGIATEVELASEFRDRDVVLPQKGGVAIAVSQSGESLDTLMALRRAKELGQKALALVNVPESSISRESDGTLLTRAGPEFGVASTKAFTAQLTAFLTLAVALGEARGHLPTERANEIKRALASLPGHCGTVLSDEAPFIRIAQGLAKARDVLYLGRGLSYPIALEGALKLKEITYVHAEGYAAGEMKHGPIALVDEHVPVVIVAPNDAWFEKTASNMAEIRARGGKVILLTDPAGAARLSDGADELVVLPEVDPMVTPILTALPVQLLAYHAAVEKGTDADQPRNLAKSVTVE